MSDIAKLMSCTPETLAKEQFDALLEFAIGRLKEVAKALKNKDWKGVRGMTFDSPAGDGMGCDNSCINFALDGDPYEGAVDIMGIVWRLEELEKMSK